jgi:hypothetical protein
VKKINLTLLRPPGYKHNRAFDEVFLYYLYHLRDLGFNPFVSENNLVPGYLNIILGYQFMPFSDVFKELDYIIIQLEQLSLDAGWFGDKNEIFMKDTVPLLQNALQIWDYSPENIRFLEDFQLKAKLMPIGYHENLGVIHPSSRKIIDVLFYGSLHPRRTFILEELEKYCKVKSIFGLYGSERDKIIRSSKIIINIHAFAKLKIMEQVRLSYLLNNKCFIISEESYSNPYGNGIISLPYDEIVPGVLEWLKKDQEREAIAQNGPLILKQVDAANLIREALEEWED